MSGLYTNILNLFKTNMNTDGNDVFDFERDLNQNWDKIDTFAGQRGQANGYAPLDSNGVVPKINLPVIDLSGKADVDFNNVNNAGKARAVGWGSPDYAKKIFKPVATNFVAEKNGLLVGRINGPSTGISIEINGIIVAASGIYTNWDPTCNAPVSKGDTYKFVQSNGNYVYGYFIPLKGEN